MTRKQMIYDTVDKIYAGEEHFLAVDNVVVMNSAQYARMVEDKAELKQKLRDIRDLLNNSTD